VESLERDEEIDNDHKLIELLLRNSRQSLREMAKEIPISPSSIRNKMERMVQDGIIERFTVDVNWRKMGYEIQVIILITSKPGGSENLYKELTRYREISKVYWTTGPANFICIAKFRNMNDLSRFMTRKIDRLAGVERIETLFLMPIPEI
jgi:Lrp/AsnC family transcriptional regulator for asnA, asnC and gidA